MSTAYSIEIVTLGDEGAQTESVGLPVESDTAAVRQLRRWLDQKGADLSPGTGVFLKFYRPSDGQRGYLNPNGASPTGSPWPLKKNRAAVALGRKGGKAKVAKGFSALTPEQRSEIGRKFGRKPSCECGECPKCKRRLKRQTSLG